MGKLDETLGAELNSLREKNLLWKIHVLSGASAPRTNIDGKEVLVMCSNNYLGLSNHPRLKRAAIQATRKYGAGSGSVRVIAGTMDLHVKLEETIARFKHTEDAIAFQ
ncbi:MAG: aminotransferase class I/II-fold pyridoxal phosphate-dependent enzyme, partial [Candidatus Micrarchaeota archaeon]